MHSCCAVNVSIVTMETHLYDSYAQASLHTNKFGYRYDLQWLVSWELQPHHIYGMRRQLVIPCSPDKSSLTNKLAFRYDIRF